MTREELQRWITAYEHAWRTAGAAELAALFAADVRYSPSPWAAPVVGLDALAIFWDAERDGPDEQFTMTAAIVAVEGAVGVARVEVAYADTTWRDLWIVELDASGRCVAFEEWPFAPGQFDGHER